MAGRSRTLRFKVLLGLTIFVVVSWSVLWFVGATVLERQVDKAVHTAGAYGAVLQCENQTVTGFPFRMELRCGDGSHAGANGVDAKISGLTVAALVYNPARLIAEMRGPVSLDAAGSTQFAGDWELAHASARLDLGAKTVQRLDAEVVAADFVVADTAMRLGEADLNLRTDPVDPTSLNFHVKLNKLESAGLNAPTDLTLQGTIVDGASMLAGRTEDVLRAVLLSGAPIVLDRLIMVHGEMALAANGQLSLDDEGFVSGELNLAVAGEDVAAEYLNTLAPDQSDTLSTVFTNLLKNTPVTTEVEGHAAKEVALKFDVGRVRVGAFPFPLPFQIPPVRVAGR